METLQSKSELEKYLYPITIGDENQNINLWVNNYDRDILNEFIKLKQENEKLRGLLNLAISHLETKDRLIKIFTKKWTE